MFRCRTSGRKLGKSAVTGLVLLIAIGVLEVSLRIRNDTVTWRLRRARIAVLLGIVASLRMATSLWALLIVILPVCRLIVTVLTWLSLPICSLVILPTIADFLVNVVTMDRTGNLLTTSVVWLVGMAMLCRGLRCMARLVMGLLFLLWLPL